MRYNYDTIVMLFGRSYRVYTDENPNTYCVCKDKRKNRSREFLFLNSSYTLLIKRRAPT